MKGRLVSCDVDSYSVWGFRLEQPSLIEWSNGLGLFKVTALIWRWSFGAATTLTSWHLGVTYCSLHVARWLKLFEHKPFDSRTVVGFAVLNGISIGLLNLSLGFNSVGFYQVICSFAAYQGFACAACVTTAGWIVVIIIIVIIHYELIALGLLGSLACCNVHQHLRWIRGSNMCNFIADDKACNHPLHSATRNTLLQEKLQVCSNSTGLWHFFTLRNALMIISLMIGGTEVHCGSLWDSHYRDHLLFKNKQIILVWCLCSVQFHYTGIVNITSVQLMIFLILIGLRD